MSSEGVRSSRSASPETTQSAQPASAASRNLSRLGSCYQFATQAHKVDEHGDVVRLDMIFEAQNTADCAAGPNQGADKDPRIHDNAHRLSPRRLDVGGDFVLAGCGVQFGKTVPDLVKVR